MRRALIAISLCLARGRAAGPGPGPFQADPALSGSGRPTEPGSGLPGEAVRMRLDRSRNSPTVSEVKGGATFPLPPLRSGPILVVTTYYYLYLL